MSFVYSAPINNTEYYSNEQRMPVRKYERSQEFGAECTPLYDVDLKVF
jgi:hypothetical protein